MNCLRDLPLLAIAFFCLLWQTPGKGEITFEDGVYHAHPGDRIQDALERAAATPNHKIIHVHAGTYAPVRKGQALLWFNRKHDGIQLIAQGEVILTAANPEIADRESASFPAVVNHVVYFGDGISRKTVIRGFKITGANHFATDAEPVIEPQLEAFKKTEGYYGRLFFYTDGGGIKIFGRSYPTIDQVELVDNYVSPCGAGISIEHRGFGQHGSVLIQNSVFQNNRCLITGAAVDLLPGSAAEIRNCLFVGNLSNRGNQYTHVKGNLKWPGIDKIMKQTVLYQPNHGSGALTVLPASNVIVEECTFTGNFNGVDDKGKKSAYRDCIFWKNTAEGTTREGKRYEIDVLESATVANCFINGEINDLRDVIDSMANQLNCEDPAFNEYYEATNPKFAKVGYRRSNPAKVR